MKGRKEEENGRFKKPQSQVTAGKKILKAFPDGLCIHLIAPVIYCHIYRIYALYIMHQLCDIKSVADSIRRM